MNMTEMLVENNGESYYNRSELNCYKCTMGIFYFVMVHFCNFASQGKYLLNLIFAILSAIGLS